MSNRPHPDPKEHAKRLAIAESQFGITFRSEQLNAFDVWATRERTMCVYYPTGTGKTKITLTCLFLRGYTEALVIAPPSTHDGWANDALALGMTVTCISHAKFRRPDYQLSRHTPVIVDEFHMLGGQKGQGWKKMDRAALGLECPLILSSATPNYNDAERVYCVAHVLDPVDHKGGYVEWLYKHCYTKNNRFGVIPLVEGFRQYKDAEEFLSNLPGVAYIPDNAPDIIQDFEWYEPTPALLSKFGYHEGRHRIVASEMEKRMTIRYDRVVNPHGNTVRSPLFSEILGLIDDAHDAGPVIIYCDLATIAKAVHQTFLEETDESKYTVALITGDTPKKKKLQVLDDFRSGAYRVLIGTASISTGTDGLDKVCDTMIIVDDTPDPSLRRQLVGRILPRGTGSYDNKVAHRFVYTD